MKLAPINVATNQQIAAIFCNFTIPKAMLYSRYKKYSILTIGILTILPIQISFWFNPPIEQLPSTLKTLRMFDGEISETPSLNQIVENFCLQSLSESVSQWFNSTITGDRYSSKQSLFLWLLCRNNPNIYNHLITNLQNPFSSYVGTGEYGYLKDTWFKTLKYAPNCTKEFDEKCNISVLTQQLIWDILGELFTLKQANLYGVTSNNFTSDKILEESIDNFTKTKVNILNNQEDFCRGKIHNYPKTCDLMKKHMKSFKKAFKDFKIIDPAKLFKEPEKQAQNCVRNTQNPEAYDHIFCNIIYRNHEGLDPFITNIYNEILRYWLFNTYYQHQISIASNPDTMREFELKATSQFLTEILTITNETIQQLSEIQNTYPIHIGLMTYQENLLRLRDKYLSKIVTPFYNLFYKLQNVQIQA